MQKVRFEIGLKKFLWLKRLKALCRGHILLVINKICFNWLTADQFTRRLAQANLVTKVDIADFVEKTLLLLENVGSFFEEDLPKTNQMSLNLKN